MSKPCISIIVPIYNVEKYMRKGIESIINQTLKELEIILVNDGSKDNSGKIADEYAKKDVRIKVIHQQNKGLPGARNSGLSIATGEYIGFIDPDDWIEECMFQEMYLSAKSKNSDIVACNIIEEDGQGNSKIYTSHIKNNVLVGDEIKKSFRSHINNKKFLLGASACNKIYKKSFLQEYNLWQDESLKIAEDFCFNINAIMNAKVISGVDKEFYHYMKINPESLLTKFNEEKVYHHIHARKKILEYLEIYNLNTDEYTRYENCKNLINYRDLCVFKIKSEKSHIKKYREIKKIFKNEEFINAFNNYDSNYLSKSMKIILSTVKLKQYIVTYVILNLYIIAKER